MPGNPGRGRPTCRGTTAAGAPCRQKATAGSAYCAAHGGGKRRVGRPSKLNPETSTAIIDAVRTGATLDVAAAAAGINVGTLHKWRDRGETDLNAAHDTIYARLVDELTRATAAGEVSLVRMIRSAGLTDWRAAAWLLERRAPSRWAREGQADDADSALLAPRTVTPAAERRDELVAILAQATRPPATTGAP